MTELKELIKPYMSEYRYLHTVSVADECIRLSRLFDVDMDTLTTAAYLHDITKEMPYDEQLSLCGEMGIILTEADKTSVKALHSFTAPAFIQKHFPDYATKEVLDAVKYHTTGRAGMTLTEKLLYLADFIEPTRKYEECINL